MDLNNSSIHETRGIDSYKRYTARKIIVGVSLLTAVLILSVVAVSAGSTDLSPNDVLMAFIGQGTESSTLVIWRIRLPRVIAAIIAGAGLAASGCVMQNNLNNPLASPSILGISNAAAFGANIAIILLGAGGIRSSSADAVNISNPYVVTLCAFAASMTAVFVILMLARYKGFSPESIILTGVALSSLFSAGTILIQYFADDVQVASAVFWTFGDLGRISWNEAGILCVVSVISLIYFMFRRWEYNAIDCGEEGAKSLGVKVENIRLGGLLVSSIITAVSVSFVGIIGFIGLISPQIVRRIIGGDHRFLIPISALMGSVLLLIADTAARTIISPVILPVGAITSFLGAPIFFYLLLRGHDRK